MMRSYREWRAEPKVNLILVETILNEIKTGMGKNMERLGQLLGHGRENWYELIPGIGKLFGRGSYNSSGSGGIGSYLRSGGMNTRGSVARSGEDFASKLQSIADNFQNGKTDPNNEEIKKLIANLRDGSPLKQVFKDVSALKSKLGTGDHVTPHEANILMSVLMNLTNGGSIDEIKLKELWHSVTGLHPQPEQANKQQAQKVGQFKLYSPYHLMHSFLQHGSNGIFSKPSNDRDLQNSSGKIFYEYFPKDYEFYEKGRPSKKQQPPEAQQQPAQQQPAQQQPAAQPTQQPAASVNDDEDQDRLFSGLLNGSINVNSLDPQAKKSLIDSLNKILQRLNSTANTKTS